MNTCKMKKGRYIRQSTAAQSNLRQLAKAHPDEELFIDVISGSIPFKERPEGSRLLQEILSGKIEYLCFHSICRAGRNTIDVLTTLKLCSDYNVVVKIENLGLESMINGKANPVFNLVTTILSELSSLERENLLERQKEGIAQAKILKKYKGRVKGTVMTKEELLEKHKKVVREIRANPNLSIRKIATLSGVAPNTVRKVIKLQNEEKEN
jgi:DNA invertase Pin-like site-specific DNA recombinase